MASQRIGRLTPLPDVLTMIGQVELVAPVEMPVTETVACILADDVVAQEASPEVALAARDGWAVDADMTRDAGPYAPMPLPHAKRIDAFAPLPDGTDAVAPIDGVVIAGGMMQIVMQVTAGDGVVPAGMNAGSGTILRKAGQRVRAIDIAVMESLGIDQVRVRKPRVMIVAPDNDAILQSIAQFLLDVIAAGGASAETTGDLDGALRDPRADAVIGIGGTGAGHNDRAVTALARAGTVACHGVAISPGETAAFGKVDTRPVLLIPGRVDAALACWLTLIHPLVMRLAGGIETESFTTAPLSRKIVSTIGMTEVVPVARDGETVTPLASGLLPLHALTQADGWVLVPAESEGFPAGAAVMIRPLP